jgi:hypothetical protein
MLLKETFRAFRHRDYAIFWRSLLLGNTTGLIQTTAQAWLIFQLTNSPFYLGLDGLCLGLRRVIFSPLGGAVVDRVVFIITQTAFLLMTFFLGVLQIHSDETNRGRNMSLFGLINRGLGPMGSFPFGVVATSIGAPWTVSICGGTHRRPDCSLWRAPLREATRIGEI